MSGVTAGSLCYEGSRKACPALCCLANQSLQCLAREVNEDRLAVWFVFAEQFMRIFDKADDHNHRRADKAGKKHPFEQRYDGSGEEHMPIVARI